MRAPSRQMPPSPTHERTVRPLAFALVMVAFVALVTSPGWFWWPLAFVFPGFMVLGQLTNDLRNRRIGRRRAGLSICDFARSFPRREVDTWILRAVYEELESWGRFPVRASDRFEFFGIVDDDIEDLFFDLAARTGRSTEDTDCNPMFGRVETVRDMVQFLNHQPLVAPRSPQA